ncbi:YolD-like family protein [Staphylococcus sp. Marseille-Q6910]|uniref:YolD-like family protein n=1 Tax=Staphylococcus sp. Marseille-Q6910 TaxID=2937990 RepID=UPI00203D5AA0|nr:YolD-like family protein [Staphylococcus sp. Marseille-Q6910]
MKVINPSMPELYRYETDYRKIPREYLNPRIPNGRGIVKWQPFKTMPQQYQILDDYMKSQDKVDMPLLSDEQIHIINDTILWKMKRKHVANLSYWKNGYISSIPCFIKKINQLEGTMSVTNEQQNETLEIPLTNIVNVD